MGFCPDKECCFPRKNYGIIGVVIISYLGHSCFRIQGAGVTVVTDPFSSSIGFAMPQTSADIVTISHEHEDHNYLAGIKGDPFVIREVGEYEIKGVEILGIPSFHDDVKGQKRGENIIYSFHLNGFFLVHLGDLGCKLAPEEVERLGEVDILFVPVGGFYTIDASLAWQVVGQLNPRIIVPMHYKTTEHNQDTFGRLDSLVVFLKTIGEEQVIPQKRLKISKRGKLPEEQTVVVLEKV